MNIITIIIFTTTSYSRFTKNTKIFYGSNVSCDLLLVSFILQFWNID